MPRGDESTLRAHASLSILLHLSRIAGTCGLADVLFHSQSSVLNLDHLARPQRAVSQRRTQIVPGQEGVAGYQVHPGRVRTRPQPGEFGKPAIDHHRGWPSRRIAMTAYHCREGIFVLVHGPTIERDRPLLNHQTGLHHLVLPVIAPIFAVIRLKHFWNLEPKTYAPPTFTFLFSNSRGNLFGLASNCQS